MHTSSELGELIGDGESAVLVGMPGHALPDPTVAVTSNDGEWDGVCLRYGVARAGRWSGGCGSRGGERQTGDECLTATEMAEKVAMDFHKLGWNLLRAFGGEKTRGKDYLKRAFVI